MYIYDAREIGLSILACTFENINAYEAVEVAGIEDIVGN
jgi:hypothetical protein